MKAGKVFSLSKIGNPMIFFLKSPLTNWAATRNKNLFCYTNVRKWESVI